MTNTLETIKFWKGYRQGYRGKKMPAIVAATTVEEAAKFLDTSLEEFEREWKPTTDPIANELFIQDHRRAGVWMQRSAGSEEYYRIKTGYDRILLYRMRHKLKVIPPVELCSVCHIVQLRGALSAERGICSKCWRDTPEGRQENAERVKEHRQSHAIEKRKRKTKTKTSRSELEQVSPLVARLRKGRKK